MKKNGGTENRKEWRKRQIILPEDLVAALFEWHGGQDSYLYSLASSGMRGLVSLSMIDAALEELDKELRTGSYGDKHDPAFKHLKDTISELKTIRQFWKEHSAKEAGLESDDDFEYEYDMRDYGYNTLEEFEIDTHSG